MLALPTDNVQGPNCAVTAVAVAAGTSFSHAWGIFAQITGKGKRWKGAVSLQDVHSALSYLGVAYDCPGVRRGAYDLWTWTLIHAAPEPAIRFLVITGGHAQIVMGRNVLDQSGTHDVTSFKGRNKRVQFVFRLTEGSLIPLGSIPCSDQPGV